jgi:hypothetical protein
LLGDAAVSHELLSGLRGGGPIGVGIQEGPRSGDPSGAWFWSFHIELGPGKA